MTQGRYRFTTFPTGAKSGPWRGTPREARDDAVAAGCAERDEHDPSRIYLDALVMIEDENAQEVEPDDL